MQRLWEQVLAILNNGYYVFYLIPQDFPCSMSVSHLPVKVQKKSVLNNNSHIFVMPLKSEWVSSSGLPICLVWP